MVRSVEVYCKYCSSPGYLKLKRAELRSEKFHGGKKGKGTHNFNLMYATFLKTTTSKIRTGLQYWFADYFPSTEQSMTYKGDRYLCLCDETSVCTGISVGYYFSRKSS